MATLSDYTSGTISLANGSATVTGTGTLFEVTRFREGDTLQIQNLTAVIASVDSDTQLTLTEPWTGTSIVNGAYRARQLGDGTRVSTQAATVIQTLGNGVLTNLAELGVEEGKVPVGGPTGEYELVDTSTFGIQDPNGSLGKLAALTLAANKAITTDGSGNAQQIDLRTLGRALLALASGTSAQYVQGDGTLQAKAGLPVSTAMQTALNSKLNNSGGQLSGPLSFNAFNASGNIKQTTTITLANNANININQSGLLIINNLENGAVGLFILGGAGGGSVNYLSSSSSFSTSLGSSGKINVFMYLTPSIHYEIKNETGAPVQINAFLISTRDGV